MKFFSVITKPQTWLNIIYLLLSFPLGIFYFVFLVTGLSVGLGLVIVWVGIPMLLVMMAAWWMLMHLERILANTFLGSTIPHLQRKDPEGKAWDQFKAHLSHELNWKGLVHLILKFPLGILSFVAIVTLGTLSLALISIPLTLWLIPEYLLNTPFVLTTPLFNIISPLAGILLLFASMHAWNSIAYVQKILAQALLTANEKEWKKDAGDADTASTYSLHKLKKEKKTTKETIKKKMDKKKTTTKNNKK